MHHGKAKATPPGLDGVIGVRGNDPLPPPPSPSSGGGDGPFPGVESSSSLSSVSSSRVDLRSYKLGFETWNCCSIAIAFMVAIPMSPCVGSLNMVTKISLFTSTGHSVCKRRSTSPGTYPASRQKMVATDSTSRLTVGRLSYPNTIPTAPSDKRLGRIEHRALKQYLDAMGSFWAHLTGRRPWATFSPTHIMVTFKLNKITCHVNLTLKIYLSENDNT